jgi:hypothetical protein
MRAVKEKECIKQELKKERMGEREYTLSGRTISLYQIGKHKSQ